MNGLTIQPNGQTLVVTSGPANFYSDTGLSAAVTYPVTVSATTVWYCSAAVAVAVPDVSLTIKQPDGSTIYSGSIRVGQTSDTFVRPLPGSYQGAADNSQVTGDQYGAGRETFSRLLATNAGTMSTGVLRLTYMTAPEDMTVGSLAVATSTTAAGATPTLIRMGIYTVAADGALALVASTASDTTLLAATVTLYTKALSASYAVTAGTRYALGLLVVTGATAPTVASVNLIAGLAQGAAPRLTAGTGSQTDLPASATGATAAGWTASVAPWFAMIPA